MWPASKPPVFTSSDTPPPRCSKWAELHPLHHSAVCVNVVELAFEVSGVRAGGCTGWASRGLTWP